MSGETGSGTWVGDRAFSAWDEVGRSEELLRGVS